MPSNLIELDSLEFLVIVDNEVDPISKYPNPAVEAYGNLADIAAASRIRPSDRPEGGDTRVLSMEDICCGAHGLSIMVTGVKDGKRRTVLFDTGPDEAVWQSNVKRLGAKVGDVEVIVLSHWHRDHSGGMLKAIPIINAAKEKDAPKVIADLHPNRPDFRGVTLPSFQLSLEADPTFEEISTAGGVVAKNADTHTLADDFFLVSGEISRVTGYEKGIRRGARFAKEKGAWEMDELILDERFLMCKLKDRGIVMFTGCSHAGVVNASRHAITLGEGAALHAVVGGYHLADSETAHIDETVADLEKLNPKLFFPGHCTGSRAKCALERSMPGRVNQSTVGTRFTL
ncbi:hypothetical protein EJ08DRAFT_639302 [Tothia fuscella]|uniref:Metallo-beta-lactamase domain-containing protein n=1 Tax=Tothia fuscella TaxID=1048955 RepID=A0A9P4NK55_9PEZI|nr:hypothetical protein EJ08DRAFT_639302 [Tothia fuscella]